MVEKDSGLLKDFGVPNPGVLLFRREMQTAEESLTPTSHLPRPCSDHSPSSSHLVLKTSAGRRGSKKCAALNFMLSPAGGLLPSLPPLSLASSGS